MSVFGWTDGRTFLDYASAIILKTIKTSHQTWNIGSSKNGLPVHTFFCDLDLGSKSQRLIENDTNDHRVIIDSLSLQTFIKNPENGLKNPEALGPTFKILATTPNTVQFFHLPTSGLQLLNSASLSIHQLILLHYITTASRRLVY